MTTRYFITGTDTEIGKTYATCKLAAQLVGQGRSVACFKPVASGAELQNGKLVNDDAVKLQQCSSVDLPLATVNPYCFEPAIAPHIAAHEVTADIDLNVIQQTIESIEADVTLVEGFGGWLSPVLLSADQQMWQADIARAVGAEVILVVGMRLGCLNHAMLSVKQILQDGFTLKGWIANQIDPDMPMYRENIDTLSELISPPLMHLSYQQAS